MFINNAVVNQKRKITRNANKEADIGFIMPMMHSGIIERIDRLDDNNNTVHMLSPVNPARIERIIANSKNTVDAKNV